MTAPEIEIALVLSPDAWVEHLHRHCADHGGARVRCMVVEPSVALDEDYRVLVATERWPALTRPFIDALHARGRRVLVVVDEGEAAALGFVERLGADGAVSSATSPAGIVDAVVALAPWAGADLPTPEAVNDRHGPDDDRVVDTRCRTLVAVGGPAGAGSTEVAIGLAAASARRGSRSVVVDADQVTPSVAVRLGLPVEPNLCTAVDAVAYGLGAVPGSVFDLGDRWPAVLVGPPSRDAADALRSSDVVAVAEVLAERFGPVVVDVSAGARVRHGAQTDVAGAVVARAAAVVAVGVATPVGIVRLLEWIGAAEHLADGAVVHAVVNRAPSARGRRTELTAELVRDGRVPALTFVPTDPRVEDSVWEAAIADRGPFVRAIDNVLEAIGAAAGSGRRRRGRS